MTKPTTLLTKMKHKDPLFLIFRCLIVFIIPVIAGMMFFKVREVHPYGENSILSIDLWIQYFPMFRQYGEASTFADGMYSWNGALGYNNFVQSAFYCRSPWLLLFKMIPFEKSIIYINYVSIIRLGLSAVTCLLFLEYKFKKRSPVLMALAVSYGLCAYSTAFIMQFMWTDLIVYAPLVLLGLERLLDKKSPLLYVAMLALSIYTNFYVGFGTCLFTLFYFIAEIIKRIETKTGKRLFMVVSNWNYLWKTTLKFALYSALSGCINAVIAIPTLTGLSNSVSANEKKLDFSEWYHTFSETVNAMLPQTPISLEYGVANIATGLFMFILIPLYFMNSSVKFHEKIASGAFLSMLYCGITYSPLDYVFNGFHFPNQLPGRWSFLISLALVTVAAGAVTRLDGIKLRNIISAYIIGVFFIFFAEYSGLSPLKLEQKSTWLRYLIIFSELLIFYVACELILKKPKKSEAEESLINSDEQEKSESPQIQCDEQKKTEKNTVASESNETTEEKHARKISKQLIFRICSFATSLALAALITAEVTTNAVDVLSVVNGGVGTSHMTSYLDVTKSLMNLAEKADSGENEFYRTEVQNGWTFNDGLLAGFKGITYYGSTMNGNVYKLLRSMGNQVYAQNISSIYNNSSVVQNSIFGVRYIIDRGRNLDQRLPGITMSDNISDGAIWENPTALPLAFPVSEKIRNIAPTEDAVRPITFQNNLVNSMYGEEINVYEKLTPTVYECHNADLDQNENWERNYFYRKDNTMPVTFNYTFICPSDNPIYLEQNFRAGNVTVSAGGNSFALTLDVDRFKSIGSYPAGTEITITADIANIDVGCCGLDVYTFNTAKWQQIYSHLNQGGLEITSFKPNKVSGKMNMQQAGFVFTSIPQDGGWTVYVDGNEVKDIKLIDSLVGFALNSGTHEITFKYNVPGYALGLTLTIFFILMTLFCVYCHHKGGIKKAFVSFIPKKTKKAEPQNKKTK